MQGAEKGTVEMPPGGARKSKRVRSQAPDERPAEAEDVAVQGGTQGKRIRPSPSNERPPGVATRSSSTRQQPTQPRDEDQQGRQQPTQPSDEDQQGLLQCQKITVLTGPTMGLMRMMVLVVKESSLREKKRCTLKKRHKQELKASGIC